MRNECLMSARWIAAVTCDREYDLTPKALDLRVTNFAAESPRTKVLLDVAMTQSSPLESRSELSLN